VTAYIGLGANLGDSQAMLARAVEEIAALPGCRLLRTSRVYRTEPQGYKEQPWFHNQVLALEPGPSWTPEALLQALLSLEQKLGRQRNDQAPRYGPRVVDLDLLLFGDREMQTQGLTLPHPRMRERAFVLVPLAEIAPDLVFPDGLGVQAARDAISHSVTEDTISQE